MKPVTRQELDEYESRFHEDDYSHDDMRRRLIAQHRQAMELLEEEREVNHGATCLCCTCAFLSAYEGAGPC